MRRQCQKESRSDSHKKSMAKSGKENTRSAFWGLHAIKLWALAGLRTAVGKIVLACILGGFAVSVVSNFQTQPNNSVLSQQDAAGYIQDVDYVDDVVSWQLPTSILQAAQFSGRVGPRLDQPLVYMDLGAGYGEGVIATCSANPNIHGVIVDMLPQHIQRAKARAASLGLSNVTCIQSTFEKFPMAQVPDCDIIVLHGVMSWIEPHIQRQALEIVRQKLKPGGLFYVSYNAYPGWAVYEPLNVLLRTMASRHPGLSTDKLAQAMKDASHMQSVGSTFFSEHPRALKKLEKISKQNPNYLVHEYMNSAQYPFYFYKMHADVAELGLEYAGDTKLLRNYPHVFLSNAQAKVCDQYAQKVEKITVMDFFLNTVFRREVYAGLASKPSLQDGGQFFYMALPGIKVDDKYEVETGHQSFNLRHSPFKDVLALCQRPISLGDIEQKLNQQAAAQGKTPYTRDQVLLAITILCEAGAIEPLWQPLFGHQWADGQANGQEAPWRGKPMVMNAWNKDALVKALGAGNAPLLISGTSGKTLRPSLLDSLCLQAVLEESENVGLSMATKAVKIPQLRQALIKSLSAGSSVVSDRVLIDQCAPSLLSYYKTFLKTALDRFVILGILQPAS
jgi:SAM-dependent methyltransferase